MGLKSKLCLYCHISLIVVWSPSSNLMHTSTDLSWLRIPGLALLSSVTFPQLKTIAGWLKSSVRYWFFFFPPISASNVMCHSTELVHQTLPGLFWSFDSCRAFLIRFYGSFGLLDATPLATLLIQSSYSLNYNQPIVLWTEAKHYLSTYAAQRWLDVFGVMAQNGPCLKCLNCDDLFECTKCLFFCVFILYCSLCFCHWGIFFVHIGTIMFCTVNIATLFYVCCIYVQ